MQKHSSTGLMRQEITAANHHTKLVKNLLLNLGLEVTVESNMSWLIPEIHNLGFE